MHKLNRIQNKEVYKINIKWTVIKWHNESSCHGATSNSSKPQSTRWNINLLFDDVGHSKDLNKLHFSFVAAGSCDCLMQTASRGVKYWMLASDQQHRTSTRSKLHWCAWCQVQHARCIMFHRQNVRRSPRPSSDLVNETHYKCQYYTKQHTMYVWSYKLTYNKTSFPELYRGN